MMYLTTLFDTLPHKEIVLEDSSELSSTSTETVQSSRVIKVTQSTYEVYPYSISSCNSLELIELFSIKCLV